MKRLTILTIALLAGGACGSGSGDTQAAADTLTRAQKDNIIGNPAGSWSEGRERCSVSRGASESPCGAARHDKLSPTDGSAG